MKNFKNISSETQKIIGISILSMIATLVVAFILVFVYRIPLFKFFAKEYAAQAQKDMLATDTTSQTATEKLPELFTQDSLVEGAVKKSNPAVVSIIISKEVPKYDTVYDNTDPFGRQDPFSNMFGIPNFNFQVPIQKQNGTVKKEIGGGSGFFVSADGLIVTNRHVIEDKTAEYTVFTNDGKKHTATVVARDSVLDIALIKIDGSGYSYLSLGDSDSLNLGQSVIAIGNALGQFKNSVSVGVVSGLSRSITAGDNNGQSESLSNVIQTDAAINPGNSGGPLLDISGKVVGVNVAIVQGSENIGFALPINSVKSVINSVKATGKIIRPYLGIRYVPVTQDLKDKNNLTVDYGDLVGKGKTASDLAVIPGSPADKAGIVENDIILEIDGQKLDQDHDLATIVRNKNVGDTVTLTVLDKGIQKDIPVKLEAAP